MAAELEAKPRAKIPLQWAAKALADLDRLIQESEDVDAYLVQAFKDARMDLAEGIDRRRYLIAYLDGMNAVRDSEIEYLKFLNKRTDDVIKRIKADTLAIMQAEPDNVYAGTSGKKLTLANNSQATLTIDVNTSSKSVGYILDQNDLPKIDSRYVKVVTYITLNTEALREDLGKGMTVPFARLSREKHVRGW